ARFMEGARKFDVGGKPNPIIVPMVKEALKRTIAWNPLRIQEHLIGITDFIANAMEANLHDVALVRP
ncbi:MAG: hypothetical protein ACK55I_40830, partial [bacterium]